MVPEDSPEARSETTGEGFVKQVGYKPESKSKGVTDEQSGESKKEVIDEVDVSAILSFYTWNSPTLLPSHENIRLGSNRNELRII